jgi:glycosyltransferase involved in cell wall biosynthesis
MKILIFLKKWAGGVGTVIEGVQKELEKKGHNVIIVSREDDLKLFSSFKHLFSLRKIYKRLIKKHKPDVIYTQDWSMALPLILPFRLYFSKHFCCYHGNEPGFPKIFQDFVGRVFGKKLIVVASSLKKRFPKSNLVCNRANTNLFSPSKKIKRVKGTVGFANWVSEEYNFSEIKKAVEDAGLKLVIAEGISKQEMPKFFNKVEYFITLPPTYAGFGLVALEAMASGVPKIVSSNYGGADSLPITKIEDNGGSVLNALRNAKSEDYRGWILQNKFTWEDAVETLIDLFEKGGRNV